MDKSSKKTSKKTSKEDPTTLDKPEIRLRLLEQIIPVATRIGLQNDGVLAKRVKEFENYVLTGEVPEDNPGS